MATTKKIKKVETPIDQRETFVSLQKNFADSDLSVEEKLKTLYDLQEADSEIDRIIQLRGELPAEVEALEGEIADLKAEQARMNAVIDEFTRSIAENKQDIVDCENAIEKYQKQLETISNSREYDSLNKEIENQELLRQIAEKNIGDIKYEIAGRRAEIEDIKDHIAIRTEDLKAKKDELNRIIESTAKEGEDRRPHHERLQPHPRERAQPPRRRFRVQRQRLRRLLQHHHPAAPRRDRFQQEAHHLRTLRPHPDQS